MYTNNQGCIVCNVVPFFPMRDQFPLKILVLKIILIYKYRSILHCGQRTHKNKKKNKEKNICHFRIILTIMYSLECHLYAFRQGNFFNKMT